LKIENGEWDFCLEEIVEVQNWYQTFYIKAAKGCRKVRGGRNPWRNFSAALHGAGFIAVNPCLDIERTFIQHLLWILARIAHLAHRSKQIAFVLSLESGVLNLESGFLRLQNSFTEDFINRIRSGVDLKC
jgi:hypothetical protein